jgi:uncharacterized protein
MTPSSSGASHSGQAPRQKHAQLVSILLALGRVGIAVSGGVDSLTLAALAWSLRPELDVTLFHGASSSVPRAARETLDHIATQRAWKVVVLDPGELADPDYARNPADRCYYCKSHLFDAIAQQFDGVVCTGANVDDQQDYRPGRRAAAERRVSEPLLQAGYTKEAVRALAVDLGLPEISTLPASPCLSSRVQTGVFIEPALLHVVDEMERALSPLGAKNLRCRIRRDDIVIEHDGLDESAARAVAEPVLHNAKAVLGRRAENVAFSAYRRGSAFLRVMT